MVSPLAYIHPEARIGNNCEIGPFCFIDANVEIGDNNVLMNSVTVLSGSRIGSGNRIFPGAVIGAIPQDLKFRGEDIPVDDPPPWATPTGGGSSTGISSRTT